MPVPTSGCGMGAGRFRLYEGCPHFSLWVCPTPERVEALRRRAGRLRHTALFATLADALASPHAEVWTDHFDRTGKLQTASLRVG